MNMVKVYSSMSSAKRGAARAKMVNPIFTKVGDKIEVVEMMKVEKNMSKVDNPVKIFKDLFAVHFGNIKRKEILAMAVEAGVARNTAATYYQKLMAAAK